MVIFSLHGIAIKWKGHNTWFFFRIKWIYGKLLQHYDLLTNQAFLLVGNQGQRWIRGQYGIKANSQPYKVVLEGIRGSGYRGDIAVDDLKLKQGLCSTMNSGKF